MSGSKRNTIALMFCLLAAILFCLYSVFAPLPLLSTDPTENVKQIPKHEEQTIKSHEGITSFELIYKQEVRGRKDVIRKYYNHNDNTTIWTLRMAGYGESSIFVMKGKV